MRIAHIFLSLRYKLPSDLPSVNNFFSKNKKKISAEEIIAQNVLAKNGYIKVLRFFRMNENHWRQVLISCR
jgi:hypothetical protein